MQIPEVKTVGRRAGRAERDDHVMPVSVNEFDVEFHEGGRHREQVFAEIRDKLKGIPGTFVNVGQPIGHRLSHMLSGVSAKIAVKIYGPDLDTLRRLGTQVREAGQTIPGLTDVNLEAQVPIPQIRIEVDRARARLEGVAPGAINSRSRDCSAAPCSANSARARPPWTSSCACRKAGAPGPKKSANSSSRHPMAATSRSPSSPICAR